MNHYRHMEIFVAIIETGQFSRAAETLGLSKSAVSHSMNDLEDYLGLQLINRTNRTLQITDAGQTYYDESVKILANLAELERRVKGSGATMSGRIRLSATVSYFSANISSIIAEFTRQNPDVAVELVLTEKILDFVDSGIDFAIRIGELKDSSLVVRKISEFTHYVCAAPAFIKAHGPVETHETLNDLNCLKFTRNPNWYLVRNGKEHRIIPKGNFICNNGEALRELAVSGQGVALLPGFLAKAAIADGRLVHLLSDYKSRTLNVSLVRPDIQHVPARVRALMDFIIERMSDEAI